jgi:hypothetical protein
MASGGARPGAGRPKGTGHPLRERAIGKHCRETGQTPLEVMLFAMRHAFRTRRYDLAAEHAKNAAPYVHARLSATKVEIKRPEEMTDDELAAALAAAQRIASGDGPTRH